MYSNKKNEFDEIKKDIEFKVWRLEREKNYHDLSGENPVYEWPKLAYSNSSYGSKDPLHIGIAIDYEKNSKTYGVSVRKEIDEYIEGHPVENVRKLKDYQELSMDDAIKIGEEVNERLALEMLEHQKNTLEKTEIKIDKNQKSYDSEIEL